MDTRQCVLCMLLLVVCVSANEKLNRKAFPHGFMFGTASAAYQYEGAVREGGKGPSIWDTFSHIAGNIVDGSNGDVAVDQYHRYKEDVKLMKKMGMDVYRFSISWSRILPYGSLKGGINRVGVAHYNNLINELLLHGIKPFVTLHHSDTPQALEDEYGGFLSQNIVRDFADYSEVCFQEFGDRVKYWITLNEPHAVAAFGYDSGIAPPGRRTGKNGNLSTGNSATEPYIVAHNLLLAHAAAVSLYKNKYQAAQKGSIGITLDSMRTLPYSNTSSDQMAAQRFIDFTFGCTRRKEPKNQQACDHYKRINQSPRNPFETEEGLRHDVKVAVSRQQKEKMRPYRYANIENNSNQWLNSTVSNYI